MFLYIADYLIFNVFGLVEGDKFTVAMHFFVYDVMKILALIFLVVSFIAFIRTYLNPNRVERLMAKSRFGIGNFIAALFGSVSPFCSCSSIPLFIGFIKARVPLGIAFSFLITSPLVNEVAFVMMGGLFGWKLAFLYAGAGILLGVVAGSILGVMGFEKDLKLDFGGKNCVENLPTKFKERLRYAFLDGRKTFSKLLPFVIFGVGIGAVIHGYVPQEFFMNYIGKYEILAVPAAVLMGIPIYAGCSTVVPLIFSITSAGVPLGTSLAFMMSIAGLSLPEAIILKRVMKVRLLAVFFSVVAVGIIFIGYLFNNLYTYV